MLEVLGSRVEGLRAVVVKDGRGRTFLPTLEAAAPLFFLIPHSSNFIRYALVLTIVSSCRHKNNRRGPRGIKEVPSLQDAAHLIERLSFGDIERVYFILVAIPIFRHQFEKVFEDYLHRILTLRLLPRCRKRA
jgi:hypothetical protein